MYSVLDVWEQGAEENAWAEGGWSFGRVEKAAQLEAWRFILFIRNNKNDQVEEDEMDGAYSTSGA
jgi:hypothetical protein